MQKPNGPRPTSYLAEISVGPRRPIKRCEDQDHPDTVDPKPKPFFLASSRSLSPHLAAVAASSHVRRAHLHAAGSGHACV
ncbi:hypothetical protein E2562_037906 [Oryza meyeriana var. granulata]|uniref:Uncharacterized protein n=1 Tax=Oryza meyeriana var. granulata TaxID=110450 RepID=A0A6G1E8K1_9ORYZ|nr:hypothetical protein E2562_037906 [Oryza meyeriana var. granulata]